VTSKGDLELKYTPGNTNDTEDAEGPSASQSFELTERDDRKVIAQSVVSRRGRHYGAHYVFCWRNDEPFLSIGPHWPFFICMWTILLVVGIVVNYYVAGRNSSTTQVVAVAVTLWQAFIYLYTALRNPGISTAKHPEDPELEKYVDYPNFCNACKVLKDEETYHCYDCDVCIKGYDHHCPWTGKCIGAGNIIPFYTFLFSTVAYIVFCIMMTVNSL